jgi:hypothetical protein
LRRVAALYYEPHDTSVLIRPVASFGSMFGTSTKRAGVCDLTILGHGDVPMGPLKAAAGKEGMVFEDLHDTARDTWYGRCLVLFTATFNNVECHGVYLRWFTPTKEEWNTSLQLRSLGWFK